ncbi:MAG TPA: MFS transporter [Candidatus Acidoferrum sp.]|nr:MFS transporter [Candidatus Acidoferrum sp.]
MTADTPRTLPLPNLLRGHPALRSFIVIRSADELSSQMLNVAIGWYVYSATRNPMSLAYVGLAQFLPSIVVLLFAGHAADRFERRKLIRLSLFLQTFCLAAFGVWLAAARPSPGPVYLLLFVLSSARAICSPAMSAILPSVVSGQEFPRAVAASSSAFQICTIVGPAIGGLIYAVSGPGMFAVATALYLLAAAQSQRLPVGSLPSGDPQSELSDKSVLAGVRYVKSNRLLLSLISLDLFAVLLGGVMALLPIYAKEILNVGPVGLGCLRCAPGAGAALVGLLLAHRTINRSAGKRMLACVAGFGVATVVFALSASFWLSLAALIVAGGFDMVSMVIRQTLVQLSTPDRMRGRVSAVNWLFIGASSELGEFESGATAALFGTVPAALLGGVGTLVIVALWALLFPELRGADQLVDAGAEPVAAD